MDARYLETMIAEMLENYGKDEDVEVSARSYAEAGVMTRDLGVVVRFTKRDGNTVQTDEFQITIKRSR